MLQVVAVFLAWWGGTRRWWILRYLALLTISLWMAQILLAAKADPLPLTEVVLSLIFAAVFHIELIVSSARTTPDRSSFLGDQDPAQP